MEGEDYSKGYSDGLKSHDRKIDRLRQEFNRQIEELQDDQAPSRHFDPEDRTIGEGARR